ncbi:MAG: hypothetical protein COB53_04695 [Elusimicrobia bacterium]|nr:MAG: hypothetical protein COB53_04695 [Elusimicrobiota bacterium]
MMCKYFFLGTDLDLASIIVSAGDKLHISDAHSPTLENLDAPSTNWVVVTDGHCSCDVAPISDLAGAEELAKQNRIRKCKKNGYVLARLARSLPKWNREKYHDKKFLQGECSRFMTGLLMQTDRIVVYSQEISEDSSDEMSPTGKVRIPVGEIHKSPEGWLRSNTITVVVKYQ